LKARVTRDRHAVDVKRHHGMAAAPSRAPARRHARDAALHADTVALEQRSEITLGLDVLEVLPIV
jgi:hypothetical protein